METIDDAIQETYYLTNKMNFTTAINDATPEIIIPAGLGHFITRCPYEDCSHNGRIEASLFKNGEVTWCGVCGRSIRIVFGGELK